MPTQLRDSRRFWGTREQKKNTTWEQKLLEAYFKEREQQNRRNTFRKHRNTRPIFERTREHATPPPPLPIPREALTIVCLPEILWNKGKMAIYFKGTKEQKKNITANMSTKAAISIFLGKETTK